MMTNISQVLNGLLDNIDSIDAVTRKACDTFLLECNSFIELVTNFVESENPLLKTLLEPVIDEIFVDFHISLRLAISNQYKASLVLARTCIESSIYIIYFVDHPVEARMWANSHKDMSFSEIINTIIDEKYLIAATQKNISFAELTEIRKGLEATYRNLSERVHGKYNFLNVLNKDKGDNFLLFKDLLDSGIKNLIHLILLRSRNRQDLEIKIPYLQRIRL